ncbi:type I-E CRISPR-associated protein Cas6/Cse3/CasE [Streptomyces triticagri]|uniref:Type I-E CRISPR-associated protein Cas6/Cse3/CasE n=1 Tax=Streptomyces triticagri TaxID=2293568 RepID=A0A372M3U0_9ACTN|nr:type I-E CRISPR-associated protein Cas6/Cse3/CasE [Streptomyces triticagri]RFU85195.1 type I-E CRISPR-associated protein Cas6/Cse3/CasE [Streptomyces triticagri]
MTTSAVLARIRLNPFSRDVQRDLRDATQMHKTLMRLVPDNLGDTPRRDTGLLFRLDETDGAGTLLVQATTALDPARLPDGYGHTQVKDLTGMFTALRRGLPVRYRITVNPAKRARLPLEQKNKRGRVVPLSGADADAWWIRKATAAGLHLTGLLPTPQRPVRPRGAGATAMRHSLIRYDGTATITDPDTLAQTLVTGIGRGKSYGAGLLSLAPAAGTEQAEH